MILPAFALAVVLTADPPPPPPPMVPAPWPQDSKAGEKPADAPATRFTEPDVPRLTSREIGGVSAPAVLPAGAIAFYGLLGAPDVGGGYRQGFGPVELEARALFNYLELSALLEAGVRIPVFKNAAETLAIAPAAAIGLKLDSGARYYDRANFAYVGLRLRAAVNASLKLTDTIVGVAQLEVPWAIAMGKAGHQVTPLLGAGAEFHLGDRLSLMASVHGGFDVIKEPLGVPQTRAAWAIRLGVGYRLF